MKGFIELTHRLSGSRGLISIPFIGTVLDCKTFTRIMFQKTGADDARTHIYEFKETYDEVKKLIAEAQKEGGE